MRLKLDKKTGPLYWCTYEHQFTRNTYMPEDRFKANIDWMAKEFAPYGYEMVCTDGWIEDSFCINENGYLTRHHDSWKHDWKYWAEYLNERGMALGVYYNPTWISPAAVQDEKITVKGTDIPVREITDLSYEYDGDRCGIDGDRFSYPNGEKALYWIDADRPGAKEYVQGYVQYFIDCHVDFLRVDFLSWYEDGIDKGRRIGRNHGEANYRKTLEWIKEAAGDKIMISLVMPHLKENGKNEFGMGQMARINEDAGTGGWETYSDKNRGQHFDYWSQCTTAFDGLIYWSRRFAENHMIMDADMLRLNTFATEEECISAVSLDIIAGAPLDIADQYDTIGERAWIYQNKELLELNQKEVVSFPLSTDPADPGSTVWIGKEPSGEIILSLFNRDSQEKKVSVDFQNVLSCGLSEVRDLWLHQDLGEMTAFDAVLPPHGCRILRISERR
ncbi:MAG: hypothetical protein MR332_13030 [Fusicatenibacter sp.]|nr:hypothetical protein [Fusicatenibacter sp.]